MTIPVKPPVFQTPPKEYDQRYMMNMIKQIQLYVASVNSAGSIECSEITTSRLPTSPIGLRAGTFYNDNGTVKVVL